MFFRGGGLDSAEAAWRFDAGVSELYILICIGGRGMKTPIEGRPGWVSYRREPGTPLSEEERAELEALKNRPDSEIDASDIPEWPDEMWKRAVRGHEVLKYWRPVKQAVSLRLDADVIAWLKKDGQGYQTRANQMLRERMLKDLEG